MQETESSRAEIQRKLTRMVRFIELEGDEKAQEINDRTEEEFHIEKGNLIQVGRIKINKEYDKKLAQFKNESQVEMSNIITSFRNHILEAKGQCLQEINEQIHVRIKSDISCVIRRWSVLQLLILEALFKLLEEDIIIQCREADVDMIRKHLSDLEEKYKLHTQHDVKLSVDENYISNDILPGIIIYTRDGNVSIDNTLDKRIEQILYRLTPLLSTIFFGTKSFSTQT